MKIEISNGELLDKFSILEIKLEKIGDPGKLVNIRNEHALIGPLAGSLLPIVGSQYQELLKINRLLWEIEDNIRDFERNKIFDDGFIRTARQVYRYNDERARIKREINDLTHSGLTEEKSYAGY
jgi:hypothetical protein